MRRSFFFFTWFSLVFCNLPFSLLTRFDKVRLSPGSSVPAREKNRYHDKALVCSS